MSAGVYNITAQQYATYTLTATWQDSTGAPIPLTNYTANMAIQNSEGTVMLTLTQASGLALGGAAGTVVVTITAAQMAGIPHDTYVYDILLTSPTGVKTRLLQGQFESQFGVTTT